MLWQIKGKGSYCMKKEPNKKFQLPAKGKLDKIGARVGHSPQKSLRCFVQETEGSKLSMQMEDTQFPKNVNRSFVC
jgi:hypothetical protein